MNSLTRLPPLGRRFAVPVTLPYVFFCRSASRLSAIHRGIRNAERAQSQGISMGKEIRRPSKEEYMSPADRRRSRAIARRNPVTYKIRKGKKDITEQPGPPRKSRAARFCDPLDPFGKSSLVKKFKTGKLMEEMGVAQSGKHGRGHLQHLQHDDFARQMMATDLEDQLAPRSREKRNGNPGSQCSAPDTTARRNHGRRSAKDTREDMRHDKFGIYDTIVAQGRVPQYKPMRTVMRKEILGNFDFIVHKQQDFDSSNLRRRERPHTRPDSTFSNDPGFDDAFGGTKPMGLDLIKRPVPFGYSTAISQFLYGTSIVEAALKANRRKLYKLYIYEGTGRSIKSLQKVRYLKNLAEQMGIQVEHVSDAELPKMNSMSESRPHNGLILEASPLPQMPITGLGEPSQDEGQPGFRVSVGHQSREEAEINGTCSFFSTEPSLYNPFVMVADQVLDPGNLGSIIRTASFLGVTALVISKRGSSPVTPVVLKASAGAAEYLRIFSVNSVPDFLHESKGNGWKTFAACPPRMAWDYNQISVPPRSGGNRHQMHVCDIETQDVLLNKPCILLVGSEGDGLSRDIRRAADVEVTIPNLFGPVLIDSLNVGVAASMLCSAFLRGKAKDQRRRAKDTGALF